MNPLILVVTLLGQLDITGYVESRPYVAIGDSLNLYGFNRGWLEFKHNGSNYGAQVAFDCFLPYDTGFAYWTEHLEASRLALWFGRENLQLIVGKQSLYWGVAKVFRPLDILNRTNYFEPGYERQGTNAILGYVSWASMTSLRGIFAPKYDFERSTVGMRFGTNFLGNDVGIDFLYRSAPKMAMLGGEITGEAEVGYWIEFGYTFEDTVDFAKLSIGADYTFPFMIYTMLEFFYDESGADDPSEYDYLKIISGERQTFGKEYLYGSIGLVQNPLFKPSVNAIVNLNDRGLIIMPEIYRGIFENVDLTLGTNIFFGPADCEFKNLFAADAQIFIWLKVYF